MLSCNHSRSRMAREKRTIEAMVGMYCASHHKAEKGLCEECAGLMDYARTRLDKCPFGEKKPACAKCAIHCYSPAMRAMVTVVMKYAGPRMISKHPILTLLHVNNPWMRRMFDSAAARYVPVNRILTFGQDEIWRQAAVNIIEPHSNDKILDICTGTGDLAIKLAKRFPNLKIYALDYSANMLAVAKKIAKLQNQQNLIFTEGDCADCGFDNDYFDYVTISFGFRNLSYSRDNLVRVLKEIYRILKSGGRFIILETNQPPNVFIRKLFHFYASWAVPIAGGFISGKKEPYSYLGSSIVKFFDQDKLIDILEAAGFRKERTMPFMFGAILLCVFQK